MAKAKFSFESNLDKIRLKIDETPEKVLSVIGKNLVKEIKSDTLATQFHQRREILKKTLGYWARKKEKDLQIGFKMSIPGIVGKMMTGQEQDPIKPVVEKNKEYIAALINDAMAEIGERHGF